MSNKIALITALLASGVVGVGGYIESSLCTRLPPEIIKPDNHLTIRKAEEKRLRKLNRNKKLMERGNGTKDT